jgi:DNA-binding FadR family transcriptional regulator
VTTVPTRLPAYQLLADELRDQITSGQLQPGERLPTEPELCARTGVSRSTVREALRLLSSQHLIVTTRGVSGGSYVAKPDAATLADSLSRGVSLLVSATPVGLSSLLEVRELVEVPMAGLVARRRTEADLAALGRTMFHPVRDDLPTKLAAQRAFHEAMAAATGNPVLELLARPLYSIANETEIVELAAVSLWRAVDADHRAILRAVVAGDAAAAERAARVHAANLRANAPASA